MGLAIAFAVTDAAPAAVFTVVSCERAAGAGDREERGDDHHHDDNLEPAKLPHLLPPLACVRMQGGPLPDQITSASTVDRPAPTNIPTPSYPACCSPPSQARTGGSVGVSLLTHGRRDAD